MMRRIVIYGNSGSGKTTLAKRYSQQLGLFHLDLDEVAWKVGQPGVREDLFRSVESMEKILKSQAAWVVEGCYSSLIDPAAVKANELVFLNPGISVCLKNCRTRPWEPGKYESREEQDKNLEMLLNWVAEYEIREDEFSLKQHRRIYEGFKGRKIEITEMEELESLV